MNIEDKNNCNNNKLNDDNYKLQIVQNAIETFRKLNLSLNESKINECKKRPLNARLDWSKPAQHLISTVNNCCIFCDKKIVKEIKEIN